mgnify:CR=1 FL=1
MIADAYEGKEMNTLLNRFHMWFPGGIVLGPAKSVSNARGHEQVLHHPERTDGRIEWVFARAAVSRLVRREQVRL